MDKNTAQNYNALEEIHWDESISVEVRDFDEQHKLIIGYINALRDSIFKNDEQFLILELFDSLSRHLQRHFSYEESYMAKFGYPGIKIHGAAHDSFMVVFLKILEDYRRTNNLYWEDVKKIFDILVTHIKGFDMKYVDFFHQHGLY